MKKVYISSRPGRVRIPSLIYLVDTIEIWLVKLLFGLCLNAKTVLYYR